MKDLGLPDYRTKVKVLGFLADSAVLPGVRIS